MADTPRIVIIDDSSARADQIRAGLSAGGWQNVSVIHEISTLAEELDKADPDIVLIDLSNPNRDLLENLSVATGADQRPVAMFVDRTDSELTRAAMRAGVSAYVVDGLAPDRIRPVLETAIERFQVVSRLRAERDAAKQALDDRKTIDRAKRLLMGARNMGEEEAYALMRKSAMDQGRKVIDIAQALVTASELMG